MGNNELRHAFEINYDVTIGNLKDRIHGSEFSESQIAEHMGYDRKTINNWTNGRSKPGYDQIEYMCRILYCSTKDIIVRNYQVEYPTLDEQKNFFKEHLHRALQAEEYDEHDDYDEGDIAVLLNVLDELECPAYNVNEMMQYMQLMDAETIQYLNGRLINVGNTAHDTGYIRKQFKYVIENMIPETEEKRYLAEEINYCTHRPFFMSVTEKSVPQTVRIYENYRDNYLMPYYRKVMEAVKKRHLNCIAGGDST